MATSIDDVIFYNTKSIINKKGVLCPIEAKTDVPFDINRVFYVYGVGDREKRGKHAHFKTKQVLICLSGKVEVICKDKTKEYKYLLGFI